VGSRSKERPRNGIFYVLPARKIALAPFFLFLGLSLLPNPTEMLAMQVRNKPVGMTGVNNGKGFSNISRPTKIMRQVPTINSSICHNNLSFLTRKR